MENRRPTSKGKGIALEPSQKAKQPSNSQAKQSVPPQDCHNQGSIYPEKRLSRSYNLRSKVKQEACSIPSSEPASTALRPDEYRTTRCFPLIPLEDGDQRKPVISVVQGNFGENQYFPLTTMGKTQQYYEKVLIESGSVGTKHNYRSGQQIAYSTLNIFRLIHIHQWPKHPNHYKQLNDSRDGCFKYYNFWDYIEAWHHVLLLQNNGLKHSWFVMFKLDDTQGVPNWFRNWWDIWGPQGNILPQDYRNFWFKICERDPNYPDKYHLLNLYIQRSWPYIFKWDLIYDQEFECPPMLSRQHYVKWWNGFEDEFIIEQAGETAEDPILLDDEEKVHLKEENEIQKKLIKEMKKELERELINPQIAESEFGAKLKRLIDFTSSGISDSLPGSSIYRNHDPDEDVMDSASTASKS